MQREVKEIMRTLLLLSLFVAVLRGTTDPTSEKKKLPLFIRAPSSQRLQTIDVDAESTVTDLMQIVRKDIELGSGVARMSLAMSICDLDWF